MASKTLQDLPVKAFRDGLARLGLSPLEVVATASQQRESTTGEKSLPSAHEVIETAVTMSGDPAMAIRIGSDLDLADYGTYGFALMSCTDIGAALDLFLRYGQSFLPSSSWQRLIHEDEIILRLEQKAGTGYQKMLATELAFSAVHKHAQLLVARPAEGVRVHLNYPKPAHFPVYEEYFPFPMEFDQEYAQIFFPDHWLRQPVRTGNPATNVLFAQQCEELLKGMSEVGETSAAVRRLLLHSAGRFLKISEVADKLHVTERTLRRRLSAEGTEFRTIFEDIRNTLARNYLRKTSLSVNEIADLLNYTEAPNFHRAFQRWNSKTPLDYRRQASSQRSS